MGVPGIDADGAGDAGAGGAGSGWCGGRTVPSLGAGLLADIRLPGRSMRETLLCLLRVNSPSLFFRL